MKIEYICHSALLIDTGDLKILTDPWLYGAAYCDQWHLFPRPVNAGKATEADVILISDGREEHLHHESLLRLNRNSRVFYPFQWRADIRKCLGNLGFKNVTEASTFHSYAVSETCSITYLANPHSSILVLEANGEVLLSISNALPAHLVRDLLLKIKARWPKIDYLFCGYGSAICSFNMLHCEGKNNLELAMAREQLLADNFCCIVDTLAPLNTIPFGSDYVLLNHGKRWINHVKFSKAQLREYYYNRYKGRSTRFICAHTGDLIERNKFLRNSGFHRAEGNYPLDKLIDKLLAEEIRSVNAIEYIDAARTRELEKALRHTVARQRKRLRTNRLNRVKYTIIVKDIEHYNCFFIDCTGGDVKIRRMTQVPDTSLLMVETTSVILFYCFAAGWGEDEIVMGCGAEINICDKQVIKDNLDIICVQLLTSQPSASRYMKTRSFSILKSLVFNVLSTPRALKQLMGGKDITSRSPVSERDLWLDRSKHETCKTNNLPLLPESLAMRLQGKP